MQNSIGNNTRVRAEKYLQSALALAAQGDLALASSLYRRALCLAPEHPTAHYLLGLALMGMGAEEEARVEWQAALDGAGEAQGDWGRCRAQSLLAQHGSGSS